jgi:hypothetical protein
VIEPLQRASLWVLAVSPNLTSVDFAAFAATFPSTAAPQRNRMGSPFGGCSVLYNLATTLVFIGDFDFETLEGPPW